MRRARSFQNDRGTWINAQGCTSLGVINQSIGMWGANYLGKEQERLVETIARRTLNTRLKGLYAILYTVKNNIFLENKF